MLSPELNSLIDATLTDGILTDQERAVIKKRALLEGYDPDEVDIYINSRLQQMQIDAQGAVAKVRKCPACGAIISYMQTRCPQCGTEITNVGATKSVQKLSDMINQITATELIKDKRQVRIKNAITSFPVPTTKEDIMAHWSDSRVQMMFSRPLCPPSLPERRMRSVPNGRFR